MRPADAIAHQLYIYIYNKFMRKQRRLNTKIFSNRNNSKLITEWEMKQRSCNPLCSKSPFILIRISFTEQNKLNVNPNQ